jgi:hypothetical protein
MKARDSFPLRTQAAQLSIRPCCKMTTGLFGGPALYTASILVSLGPNHKSNVKYNITCNSDASVDIAILSLIIVLLIGVPIRLDHLLYGPLGIGLLGQINDSLH